MGPHTAHYRIDGILVLEISSFPSTRPLTIRFILQTLHENIHPYFENFLTCDPLVIEENDKDLCEIGQAVEAGDGSKAREPAQHPVRRFNQLMIQFKQLQTSGGTH